MKRQRVDEVQALAVAAVSGLLLAVIGGLDPTGIGWWDPVLVMAAAGFATWAAASAPWWAVTAPGGLVAATAFNPIVVVLALIDFVVGLRIAVLRRNLSTARAVVVGVALNLAAHSDLELFLGASAIVGVGAGLLVAAFGVARRRRRVRKIGVIVVASVATVVVAGGLGLVVAASASRPHADSAITSARRAVRQVRSGDVETAEQWVGSAAASLDRASTEINRPWARLSALLPGLSQNRRAVAGVVGDSQELVGALSRTLSDVEPDAVALSGGQVDLDVIREIGTDLHDIEDAIDELAATIVDVDSPWLIGAVRNRLQQADDEITTNRDRVRELSDIVDVAPAMLGEAGPRRYLVLFTQPAEARGLGGFPGNFAEIVFDDGALELGVFGRHEDLEEVVRVSGASCDECPRDFLDRWGQFGFELEDGIAYRSWSNITMSPHFPSVAEVAAVLYPQSGGRPIDGVMAADPYVIAQLLEYTGPVRLADGTRLTARNAAEFLISGQYLIDDRDDRIDVLAEAADLTMESLLQADLPGPAAVVDDFSDLVSSGRLVFWPFQPDEQAALGETGLAGALPEPPGFGVVANNGAGNKIDMYMKRSVVLSEGELPDGTPIVRARISMVSDVPTGRLPNIVVGNLVDKPNGTNLTMLTIYGPERFETATIDGSAVDFTLGTEQGWPTHTTFVELARGEGTVIEVEFIGELDELNLFERPTAQQRP